MVLGIDRDDRWQLPPTTAASVYPYNAKENTLRRLYGAVPAGVTGLSGEAGHPIYVSVASNDALPVAVGSTAAVLPSQIVLRSFSLSRGTQAGGTVVDSVVLVPVNVDRSAVTNAQSVSFFRFPTSMMLIPTAPLQANTDYFISLRATVKGRAVTVDSTFRTGTD